MTRRPRSSHSITIPLNWTPAEAEAVIRLLDELAEQVYRAYEEPLLRLARRDALGLAPDLTDSCDDDPLPF